MVCSHRTIVDDTISVDIRTRLECSIATGLEEDDAIDLKTIDSIGQRLQVLVVFHLGMM